MASEEVSGGQVSRRSTTEKLGKPRVDIPKFTGKRFFAWQRQFKAAISLSGIDETLLEREPNSNDEIEMEEDKTLQGLLALSLEPTIIPIVFPDESPSHKAYERLKTYAASNSAANITKLQTMIMTAEQRPTSSPVQHVNYMQSLFAELSAARQTMPEAMQVASFLRSVSNQYPEFAASAALLSDQNQTAASIAEKYISHCTLLGLKRGGQQHEALRSQGSGLDYTTDNWSESSPGPYQAGRVGRGGRGGRRGGRGRGIRRDLREDPNNERNGSCFDCGDPHHWRDDPACPVFQLKNRLLSGRGIRGRGRGRALRSSQIHT